MIAELQAKSEELSSSAGAMAGKLADAEKKRVTDANVCRLAHKRLAYEPETALRRQNSWKGSSFPFSSGFVQEEWLEAEEKNSLDMLERP